LAGIGAGTPGSVDWREGVLRGATNLDWHDLPIAAALRKRYGVPALLDNDVNVAAWGEVTFGTTSSGTTAMPEPGSPWSVAGPGPSGTANQEPGMRNPERLSTSQSPSTSGHSVLSPQSSVLTVRHLVFITVGTGIGSGIVEAGRIVRGRRSAGEIGHIPVLEGGPRCRCGMVGCLEAAAAGPGFAAAARRLAAAGEAPGLLALAEGDLHAITVPLVIQAALAGDAGALRALDREGYYLALAVLIAGRMLDPEVVVLGGGVAEAGAPVFDALWRNLAHLRPRGPDPSHYAIPSRLGADAGAIGAASLILNPEPGFAQAGLI
jgi:predicted NBD/HSP70 family sugar kinase